MKLNLGCGGPPSQMPGYLNCDYAWLPGIDIQLDITKLPFKEDSVSVIECHQVLEHIEKKQVSIALQEFYRILEQSGYIYISVPNWEWVLKELRTNNNYNHKEMMWLIYGNPLGEHKYCWTYSELKEILDEIGFYIIHYRFGSEDTMDHSIWIKAGK